MPEDLAAPEYIGQLGDGLICRWSTEADVGAVAQFMGTVHRDESDPMPNPGPMAEARLMLGPTFPYMTPRDVALVQDTSEPNRPIVACAYFWRQTWSYAGIPFGVTRPEMVATLPQYRRRGLVRAIFDMTHARSAAEGHLLQVITGIYYFYRQFGYDYALDLEGGRGTYLSLIPEKAAMEPDLSQLRIATFDDVPRIMEIYRQRRASSLVRHEAIEAGLRFEVGIWDDPAVRGVDIRQNGLKGRYWMILDAEQSVVGYTWLPSRRRGQALTIYELEFANGVNIIALLPSLLRRIRDHALSVPAMSADAPHLKEIVFELGSAHPMYDAMGNEMAPRVIPAYAWYVRMPDVAAFIRRITPELEARIARSFLAGFTGTPRIDLYRSSLELRFERGKLHAVEVLRDTLAEEDETCVLRCPPINFPQLLLGYRSLDELRHIFPDVRVKDDRQLLVNTLFPKQHSNVDPMG
jgi:hypothetical protein